MSKHSLEACKSGKDFLSYAQTHGATVRNGSGSHFVASTAKGSVVVPYHASHDLGTGLRHKIVKAFIALGIMLILAACIASSMGIV